MYYEIEDLQVFLNPENEESDPKNEIGENQRNKDDEDETKNASEG